MAVSTIKICCEDNPDCCPCGDVPCCPGVILPTTLFATFTNTTDCPCLQASLALQFIGERSVPDGTEHVWRYEADNCGGTLVLEFVCLDATVGLDTWSLKVFSLNGIDIVRTCQNPEACEVLSCPNEDFLFGPYLSVNVGNDCVLGTGWTVRFTT